MGSEMCIRDSEKTCGEPEGVVNDGVGLDEDVLGIDGIEYDRLDDHVGYDLVEEVAGEESGCDDGVCFEEPE